MATAFKYQESLVSADNLLFSFMEEETDFLVKRLDNTFIEISSFKENEIKKRRKDSKGYINNSFLVLNRKNIN